MEKSGENGSEDLILRKLNKNNNNNCQQPEQEQTSSKLLNRKTGETHIISFHGRVKPGIQSTNGTKTRHSRFPSYKMAGFGEGFEQRNSCSFLLIISGFYANIENLEIL